MGTQRKQGRCWSTIFSTAILLPFRLHCTSICFHFIFSIFSWPSLCSSTLLTPSIGTIMNTRQVFSYSLCVRTEGMCSIRISSWWQHFSKARREQGSAPAHARRWTPSAGSLQVKGEVQGHQCLATRNVSSGMCDSLCITSWLKAWMNDAGKTVFRFVVRVQILCLHGQVYTLACVTLHASK